MTSLLGTLVNAATVIVGGLIGLFAGKLINKKIGDAIMQALGLSVLYIGISGAMSGKNVIITIISIAIGTLIGTALDLDGKIEALGQKIQNRFSGNENSKLAQGFVSASLLFCVGAMSITGPLESGLAGDHSIQFTKAILDGIGAIIFASSLGAGVLLSAAFILFYQGSITLLAVYIKPILTEFAIGEMTCVGSLLIIALGLNMLGVMKMKVMNLIPSVFVPIALCAIPYFNNI